MDQVLLDVSIPMLGKKMEFFIPKPMTMGEAKNLILKMLSETYSDLPQDGKNTWLIDVVSKKEISDDITCGQSGLQNGSQVILVLLND